MALLDALASLICFSCSNKISCAKLKKIGVVIKLLALGFFLLRSQRQIDNLVLPTLVRKCLLDLLLSQLGVPCKRPPCRYDIAFALARLCTTMEFAIPQRSDIVL